MSADTGIAASGLGKLAQADRLLQSGLAALAAVADALSELPQCPRELKVRLYLCLSRLWRGAHCNARCGVTRGDCGEPGKPPGSIIVHVNGISAMAEDAAAAASVPTAAAAEEATGPARAARNAKLAEENHRLKESLQAAQAAADAALEEERQRHAAELDLRQKKYAKSCWRMLGGRMRLLSDRATLAKEAEGLRASVEMISRMYQDLRAKDLAIKVAQDSHPWLSHSQKGSTVSSASRLSSPGVSPRTSVASGSLPTSRVSTAPEGRRPHPRAFSAAAASEVELARRAPVSQDSSRNAIVELYDQFSHAPASPPEAMPTCRSLWEDGAALDSCGSPVAERKRPPSAVAPRPGEGRGEGRGDRRLASIPPAVAPSVEVSYSSEGRLAGSRADGASASRGRPSRLPAAADASEWRHVAPGRGIAAEDAPLIHNHSYSPRSATAPSYEAVAIASSRARSSRGALKEKSRAASAASAHATCVPADSRKPRPRVQAQHSPRAAIAQGSGFFGLPTATPPVSVSHDGSSGSGSTSSTPRHHHRPGTDSARGEGRRRR
uniref:Uncharacterized protein n=2 Tax=Emiliania huxleyi TaxID=2903 RepID=A0A7S3W6D2_EMIHU|mmetsp:Transcript_17437/g.51782  ORF Transcript_17437/g.51782 Transcript_17437/m.51782 type:complete len:552 (-) Transcript_17437:377-2032(-)